MLCGSSGFNALLVLEGKFDGKRTRGRPRRTWIDDATQWMSKKKYDEVKRLAGDMDTWRKTRRHIIMIMTMTVLLDSSANIGK